MYSVAVGISCRCLIGGGSFGLGYNVVMLLPCWFCVWMIYLLLNGVLKFIVVLMPISSLLLDLLVFASYTWVLWYGCNIYWKLLFPLIDKTILSIYNTLLIFYYCIWFKVSFVRSRYGCSCFLCDLGYMEYISPSFNLQSICVLRCKVSFL
jgi:hypothetical protein